MSFVQSRSPERHSEEMFRRFSMLPLLAQQQQLRFLTSASLFAPSALILAKKKVPEQQPPQKGKSGKVKPKKSGAVVEKKSKAKAGAKKPKTKSSAPIADGAAKATTKKLVKIVAEVHAEVADEATVDAQEEERTREAMRQLMHHHFATRALTQRSSTSAQVPQRGSTLLTPHPTKPSSPNSSSSAFASGTSKSPAQMGFDSNHGGFDSDPFRQQIDLSMDEAPLKEVDQA